MRLGLARATVGCLGCVGALLLAGCADGGGRPLSPTAASTGGVVVSAAPPASAATANGTARPFEGSLTLTLAAEPEFLPPSTVSVHFTGTGTATHLGRFTATFDVLIDVADEPLETSSGSLTLRAANGDSLFGDVTGHATVDGDVTTIVETVSRHRWNGPFCRGDRDVCHQPAVDRAGATAWIDERDAQLLSVRETPAPRAASPSLQQPS